MTTKQYNKIARFMNTLKDIKKEMVDHKAINLSDPEIERCLAHKVGRSRLINIAKLHKSLLSRI